MDKSTKEKLEKSVQLLRPKEQRSNSMVNNDEELRLTDSQR
jgi:hypothetical protein